MSNVITMKYGDYSFSPVPMLNITEEFKKTPGGNIIGIEFKATLKGTLVDVETGGYFSVDAAQDELRTAFGSEGLLFEIKCDDNTIMSVRPRIVSVDFEPSSDNWVFTSPYNITLEFDGGEVSSEGEFDATEFNDGFAVSGGLFINDASESWNLEFVEEKPKYVLTTTAGTERNHTQLKVSHQVSAGGKRHYDSDGSYIEAWEQAKKYVKNRLGFNSTKLQQSSVFNLDTAIFQPFNHMRVVNQDELGGKYSVTETWLVLSNESGVLGNAIEDFTVDIKTSLQTSLTTVTIQGSIQGVETRTYGTDPGDFAVTETKYESALTLWNAVKDANRIYPRANAISGLTLNTNALSRTVGHNIGGGLISYNYEYDSRPANCVSGSLTENITITDNNPVDVFASLAILGRAAGPILQDMGTVTAAVREVNVEVVMPIATGCSTDATAAGALLAQNPKTQVYNNLIKGIYDDLVANYGQVFKHQDNETWQPKTGRYTRNISWTYQDCN